MDTDLHSLPARGNEYDERESCSSAAVEGRVPGSGSEAGAGKFGREGSLEQKVGLVSASLSSAAAVIAGDPTKHWAGSLVPLKKKKKTLDWL